MVTVPSTLFSPKRGRKPTLGREEGAFRRSHEAARPKPVGPRRHGRLNNVPCQRASDRATTRRRFDRRVGSAHAPPTGSARAQRSHHTLRIGRNRVPQRGPALLMQNLPDGRVRVLGTAHHAASHRNEIGESGTPPGARLAIIQPLRGDQRVLQSGRPEDQIADLAQGIDGFRPALFPLGRSS